MRVTMLRGDTERGRIEVFTETPGTGALASEFELMMRRARDDGSSRPKKGQGHGLRAASLRRLAKRGDTVVAAFVAAAQSLTL